MQELPNALFELTGQAVVASEAATSEVGDIINAIAAGVLGPNDVIHLAELVAGKRSIDVARTAVQSVGTALYDLYAAMTLVERAE